MSEVDLGGRVGRSRRRVLGLFGLGLVAITGAGVAGVRFVRSPQEARADAAPPDRSVLTATVQNRVLRQTVVLRGTVGSATTVDVTPQPHDVDRVVLTGQRVTVGKDFGPGQVVLEVSGRPLIALRGAVPAYRDLRPGSHGRDVAQLQAALRELGHDPHETDATFGPGTKQALAALYDAIGYDAPTTGASDDQAVAAAGDQVRSAGQALAAARATAKRTPGPDAAQQVQFAQDNLDHAQQAYDDLVRTTGVMLPLAEVVFLPAFPARLDKINATIGGTVTAPLATLSAGALVVTADLNPAQRPLLRPGQPVEITSELQAINAAGTINAIGQLGQDPAGNPAYPMTVTAAGKPLDRRLAGADVRLTVEAASTGTAVTVVPLSAVFSGADGRVSVLKLHPDGGQERIEVTAGFSGDGYVAVTPANGSLGAGDLVVVGQGGGGSP
jgi:hypothetical protein